MLPPTYLGLQNLMFTIVSIKHILKHQAGKHHFQFCTCRHFGLLEPFSAARVDAVYFKKISLMLTLSCIDNVLMIKVIVFPDEEHN